MVGAIALTKFNEISSEIVNFRNKSFDINHVDEARAVAFIDELKPLTKTDDKALAFSLLGTLYCLLGDLNNMEFNYRTALKFSPGDIRISLITQLIYTTRIAPYLLLFKRGKY